MTRPTINLPTSTPVWARMGGSDRDLPILSFMPVLEGVFDIHPMGTPAERADWLDNLAEQATRLAVQVRQAEAFASYGVSA